MFILQKKDDFKQSDTAVEKIPCFVRFMAFCYFPSNLMVGPLIPYNSFSKFVDKADYNSQAVKYSLFRLLHGLASLAFYLIGSAYWPIDYLLSEEFYNSSLMWKLFSMALVSKIYLHKYILCWFFAEACCILSGITYNGENFNDFQNINFYVFEFSTSFGTIIKSYNISTNQFAFKYIYKRLKFLGSPLISQILTLVYLSIWHGFASGYHFSFSIEFLIIYFEKQLSQYYEKVKNNLNFKYLDTLIWIIGKWYTFIFTGYSFVPFIFLYVEYWYPIMSSVYFIGHIFLVPFFCFTMLYSLSN